MEDQASALLLTLAVELPLAALLARALAADPRRTLLAALVASCVTHPVAWSMAEKLGPDDYSAGVAIIEGTVIVAEAGIYRLVKCCRLGAAISISAGCNAASWIAGIFASHYSL